MAVLAAALMLGLPSSAASANDGHPLRSQVASQGDPTPDIVLRGRGWGHSVGMSQFGAYAMAREGRSARDILRHYYPGTDVATEEERGILVTIGDGAFTQSTVRAVNRSVPWRIGSTDASQPDGERWTVRRVSTGDGPRVEVLRPTGSGTVRVGSLATTASFQLPQATSPDKATSWVEAYNPAGTMPYAYGRTDFTADGSSSTLRMRQPLSMESYLRGIREVPSGWGGASGGQAALEAQVITARTYAAALGHTIPSATPRHQVFRGASQELEATGGNWIAAVRNSGGTFLKYQGSYAQTYYSSSHGGRTEASEDSWAYGTAVPYLQSVDDPWSLDAANGMRSWTSRARYSDFRRIAGSGLSRIERITMGARTAGGTPSSIAVHGPEGRMVFQTTPSSAQTRSCNRRHAGNSLRCDLPVTTRNAAGQNFTGSGDRPPSSQITSIGFAPFTDDDGSVHEFAIVWANAAGIAEGTSDTTYHPRRAVTRGQMASFLYRTFDVPRRTSSSFSDVGSGPHAEAIASVSAAGIAQGYSDGTYRPGQAVTREQMATFLTRAMGLQPRDPSQFDDVSGTHARNVGALAASGVTDGCRAGKFCPREPVRRDQMATFLYRAARSMR